MSGKKLNLKNIYVQFRNLRDTDVSRSSEYISGKRDNVISKNGVCSSFIPSWNHSSKGLEFDNKYFIKIFISSNKLKEEM